MQWFGTRSLAGSSTTRGPSDSATGDLTADVKPKESLPLQRLWLRSLSICIVAGAIVVLIFAGQSTNASLGVAGLLAGACLLVGGLLGFLFGVPRSARGIEHSTKTTEGVTKAANAALPFESNAGEYRPNTNLEEVSDWLTKILVGVGLTQLINAPATTVAFGAYFGPALGGSVVGERFALCVLVYFSVAGFLISYLWTRLYLGGALAGADAEALARVERKLDAQQLQAQDDVAAIAAVSQQLQRQVDSQEIPAERLKKVIKAASNSIRAQVFYQAAGQRAGTWRDQSTKVEMERTIPVFEALIASDVEKRYHENWGQLGFALKDQRSPDWQRALDALNTAIEMRGDAAKYGFWLYEFNRVLCLINLDEDFRDGRPSTAEVAEIVLRDVRVIRGFRQDAMLRDRAEIERWLALNHSQ